MTNQAPDQGKHAQNAADGSSAAPNGETAAHSGFRDRARAPATVRAYRADWSCFTSWCETNGRDALPAEPATVAAYLADKAGPLKVSTLNRRLVAIGHAHRGAGHDNPTKDPEVTETFRGIKRTVGTAPDQKAPVTIHELRLMVESLDDGLAGIRDRAVLLVGFAGAFRRSAFAALDVADLKLREDGYLLRIRRDKNDQEGRGRTIPIFYGASEPTCPVRALTRWLSAAGIDSGPVWRSVDRHGRVGASALHPASINTIVKRTAEKAGLDPDRFGAHSLRAGFVTTALANGVDPLRISGQTGHRSLEMVREYDRRDGDSLFRGSAADQVGL